MKLVVITPHFSPDVAPTGELVTRLVEELAARDHTIEVVTALPWYRHHAVEDDYTGRLFRYEDTPWGRITRIHPFPSQDKRRIVARAAGYAGFSVLAAVLGGRGPDVDAVLAVSPPLTLGVSGLAVARARRAGMVFNVQDVYPDVAIELGVLTGKLSVGAARRMETACYRRAQAITVPSHDQKANILANGAAPEKIHVIPNFVDTTWLRPGERENSYRREFGLQDKTVVMYAGNVGLSQSLDLLIEAAAALSYDPDLVFVINGQGAKRAELEAKARGLGNLRFVDMQPYDRLPEVLAAGDIHIVPLRRGLARSSVPSKIYSSLAAGRPVIASVDEGSEIARTVAEADAGVNVPPEDAEALTKAIRRLIDSPDEMATMGAAGRAFVVKWASPAAVATAYEELFDDLTPSA